MSSAKIYDLSVKNKELLTDGSIGSLQQIERAVIDAKLVPTFVK